MGPARDRPRIRDRRHRRDRGERRDAGDGADFDDGLSSLQWTLNAYTLALAALLLLGDRLGRRRVLTIGVAWFAAASLLCAITPTVEALIAARALQGVGGALLTPGSLAIIQAPLHRAPEPPRPRRRLP